MVKEDRLEKLLRQLTNLAQNKDKTKEELLSDIIYSMWDKSAEEDNDLGYLLEVTDNKDEKEFLNKRLAAYKNDFDFNISTDTGDLRVILLLELQIRRITKLCADRKDKIDTNLADDLNKYIKQLSEVKGKLGISKIQRQGSQQTPFDQLQEVKQLAVEYIQKHKDEYTWKCTQCGTIHLLARKHSAYDEDGGIWNPKLIELHNQKKLTIEEVAEILETSCDAIKRICQRKGIKLK